MSFATLRSFLFLLNYLNGQGALVGLTQVLVQGTSVVKSLQFVDFLFGKVWFLTLVGFTFVKGSRVRRKSRKQVGMSIDSQGSCLHSI